MKKNSYTTYIPELGAFVSLHQMSQEDIKNFVEELSKKLKKGNLSVLDYADIVVNKLIEKSTFKAIEKMQQQGTVSDLVGVECLFAGILTVYPILEMSNVCALINSINDVIMVGESEVSCLANCSTTDGIDKLRTALLNKVIGQDEAIEAVMSPMKLLGAGIETSTTLFFVGPTGVGKTELSRTLADNLLGEGRLIKVNCGEYSGKGEYSKLIGSPPGYIGHDKPGLLTEKAEESSQWVFLFDEIEKASESLLDLLLALLDDGTIMDSQGSLLDFTNSIFLFTSNIGLQENMGKKEIGFGKTTRSYKDSKEGIEDSFKNAFKPEFINRIDKVVYFNALTRDDAFKIAKLHIKHLPIKPTKKLIEYIVTNAFSEEYGARNIKRFIKNDVAVLIAEDILLNGKGRTYSPEVVDGKLTVLALDEKLSLQL